jgi:hypothetical protein
MQLDVSAWGGCVSAAQSLEKSRRQGAPVDFVMERALTDVTLHLLFGTAALMCFLSTKLLPTERLCR